MRILIALGGNALLKRGTSLTAAHQQAAIVAAAPSLAAIVRAGHQLIVTHGNGPQVGLLALQSAAGPVESALPLDALDAESQGWLGFAIELALRNASPPTTEIVTMLTQIEVAANDPAFATPAKPIGPVYTEAEARQLAAASGWSVAPDGIGWRRVVASPLPVDIIERRSITRLIEAGAIVICGGGGGIPVVQDSPGRWRGVEAVIDKDASSAMLARILGADLLVILTDVLGVYLDYGKPGARLIKAANPAALAPYASDFHAGSMGPKVDAACDFANLTGKRAVIGALEDLASIIDGVAGTQIASCEPTIAFATS
jgi:carbamate kinase